MKVFGGRAFLNRPGHHGVAGIVAEVQDTSRWKEDRKYSEWDAEPHTTLELSDCSRVITLSIDWADAADRRNSLQKVDTLIKVLTAFREGLEVEQKRYAKRKIKK